MAEQNPGVPTFVVPGSKEESRMFDMSQRTMGKQQRLNVQRRLGTVVGAHVHEMK